MNAPWVPALAIEQPSPSCHGVARPCAVSGLAGTVSEQFIDSAAWAGVWFMLMASPAPSTGVVARPPSLNVATGPLANELAGATVVVAAPPAPAAAGVLALAVGLALADALGFAPNADCLIGVECELLETAMTIPRVRPNATGMARGTAIRTARFRCVRRRIAGRCPVSIQSTSMSAISSRWLTLDQVDSVYRGLRKIFLDWISGIFLGELFPTSNMPDSELKTRRDMTVISS